jgi:hypothetical protein
MAFEEAVEHVHSEQKPATPAAPARSTLGSQTIVHPHRPGT